MLNRLLRRLRPTPIPETLSSIDAYARWAASYPPHAHNPLMQAEQDAVLALLPDVTGRAVLDLACGTGRYGILARERGAKTVIGLDNSAAMLLASPLTHRALATSEVIPLASASIDVVICALALGHLPRLKPSLAEIGRVLKSGGIALVSDFHPLLFFGGGRRTFSANGAIYAVEHYAHLYGDYHHAARDAGLRIDDVLEPRLSGEYAGHGPAPDAPVVVVYKLFKP